MRTYFEGKDVRYHLKSALITFLSVFIPLLVLQLSAYNLDGLTPSDVTGDSMVAALVAFSRVCVVAAVQAFLMLAKKK